MFDKLGFRARFFFRSLLAIRALSVGIMGVVYFALYILHGMADILTQKHSFRTRIVKERTIILRSHTKSYDCGRTHVIDRNCSARDPSLAVLVQTTVSLRTVPALSALT